MRTVCKGNSCTGCKACVQVCNKGAIHILDAVKSLNACIDNDKCANCGLCEKVCQVNHPVDKRQPIYWFQGWANNVLLRENAASGGFASAIANYFVQSGGLVVTCYYECGKFQYGVFSDSASLRKAAGSKYVKSDMGNTYINIKDALIDGKKVLFIGLPCHVAGLLKYIGNKYTQNLYTIDLICHGTPSIELLKKRLKECGLKLENIRNIRFRVKSNFRLYEDDLKPLADPKLLDPYMFTFLRGLSYSDNCYKCQYAGERRVADITIGDSWGSKLSKEEQERGISLALGQTEKGKKLLEESDLTLLPVDSKIAKVNNYQLNHPMERTSKGIRFMAATLNGCSYTMSVFTADPIVCIRQIVKKILIKLKILRGKASQYILIVDDYNNL